MELHHLLFLPLGPLEFRFVTGRGCRLRSSSGLLRGDTAVATTTTIGAAPGCA